MSAAGFVALLGAAVTIAIVAERIRIPAAVALVAFGAIVSSAKPVALPFAFGDALLAVFLPPLIFEAAWTLDLVALRRMAWSIAVLAVPGVLITTGVIAFGLAATGLLPLVPAFVFGAIVSATDPVAVIAIFRRLGIPLDLRVLVDGESIANDGVAIALYAVALAFVAHPAGVDGWALGWKAIIGMIGGAAIGAACAAVVGIAVRGAQQRSAELTATIVLAYGAYAVAQAADCSGVIATAAAGVTFRAMQGVVLTASTPKDVDDFWGVIAFVANAIVFLSTGLMLQVSRILHEPLLALAAIGAVFAARALLAYGVLPLLGVRAEAPGWKTATFFAGMRGALTIALALGLPAAFPHRAEIVDATYAVVLVTLVVQGLSMETILRRLPLAPEPSYGGSWIGGPSPSS